MRNAKLPISIREILYVIVALLVFFEIYLMEIVGPLKYVDEAVAVVCLLKILIDAFKRRLDRSQTFMLLLMLLILGIGLVSNYYTLLQKNWEAIFTDVGNCFKVFVTYVGATLFLRPVKDKRWIIRTMATVMRGYVILLFLCLILHLTGIYRMGADVRYGIPSFQFFNYGAGQLSFMFYGVFTVLTVDLRYDRHYRQLKLIIIGIAALVWASTLRTRAFLYIAMFFALYWLIIIKGYNIKLNWKTALVAVLAMLILSLDQIETYFGNEKTARFIFLERGIYTMQFYFPFGAGFSCYGTDAAVKYYARLYIRYGFGRVWGLSPNYPIFAHDTYWPAIMAQFGFFGFIAMIGVVIRWVRDLLNRTKYDKFAYLAGLFVAATQVSASVATATFFHFVTLALCFILPILFDDSTPKKESEVSYEKSNSLHPNV